MTKQHFSLTKVFCSIPYKTEIVRAFLPNIDLLNILTSFQRLRGHAYWMIDWSIATPLHESFFQTNLSAAISLCIIDLPEENLYLQWQLLDKHHLVYILNLKYHLKLFERSFSFSALGWINTNVACFELLPKVIFSTHKITNFALICTNIDLHGTPPFSF